MLYCRFSSVEIIFGCLSSTQAGCHCCFHTASPKSRSTSIGTAILNDIPTQPQRPSWLSAHLMMPPIQTTPTYRTKFAVTSTGQTVDKGRVFGAYPQRTYANVSEFSGIKFVSLILQIHSRAVILPQGTVAPPENRRNADAGVVRHVQTARITRRGRRR